MAVNALRRRNRQQELLDFSLKDVYGKMQMDHLDLQEWLRSMGLLALPLCPLCQGSMSPRNDEHHNGWVCHRRSCRTDETKVYVPARKGSFFEKSNLAESAVFALSYFWLRDMGTVKDKAYELNIGHCSVVQWEQYFRDVCAEHYRRNPPVIGGLGCTVEIDETLVARRKYNHGRWVRRHQWLFGGIERVSGRAFLGLVRRREAASPIGNYIRLGTTIIDECWRAYSQIAALPNGLPAPPGQPLVEFCRPTNWCPHSKRRVVVAEIQSDVQAALWN